MIKRNPKPAQTHYLNPKNPDVQIHQNGYKLRKCIPQYEDLTPEQLQDFELDFLTRLPLFQQERDYRYPFFLNLNRNEEVDAAFRARFSYGRPLTDPARDDFELQFAARKVVELGGCIDNNGAIFAAM